MRVVIQRVIKASVSINGAIHSKITIGLLLLVGIESADNKEDADWLIRKILQMRVFNDDAGKMNKSIIDVNGEALVVSQFTLHASTKKGNRPSFIQAAQPEIAVPLYEYFIKQMAKNLSVKTGVFGADMQLNLINDGPVTIVIDSKNRV